MAPLPVAVTEKSPHLRIVGGGRSAPEALEPQDFDGVYRRYAPYVATIGLRILGDMDEADDLVQEVFLVAHRSLDSVKERDKIRGWLATVAVRKSMGRLRRVRLKRLLAFEDAPEYEKLADPGASPEERLEVARLYRRLDVLRTKDRLVWILRHLEGHTLDEVVKLTGFSKSTVQRRLRAGEQRLLQEEKK